MKKIIIATHKSYAFPSDDLYIPLFVGSSGKEDVLSLGTIHLQDEHAYAQSIMRDDMDENISEKNPQYCELTGLYWAWKNLSDADAIGLMHYRRYFTEKSYSFCRGHEPTRCALTSGELDALMERYDILVPRKRIYGIETLYSHYAHTLDGYQLDAALDIVRKLYPEFTSYVKRVYDRRWGYMFNMMVMKRDDIDAYCKWLFDILFALEERLEGEGYLEKLDRFEARLFGRISEILFNAWLLKRTDEGAAVGEVSVLAVEKEDWIKKGRSFLEAKFMGRKYGESF